MLEYRRGERVEKQVFMSFPHAFWWCHQAGNSIEPLRAYDCIGTCYEGVSLAWALEFVRQDEVGYRRNLHILEQSYAKAEPHALADDLEIEHSLEENATHLWSTTEN
jgi:hypothetical protein